jgi:DNA mismatch endonuclease Vsr
MAQPTYEQLLDIINRKDQRIAELQTQVRQLTAQLGQVTSQLQEVLRANKRQAAPFSKGPPKDPPATPDLVFSRLKKIINVSGCFWHMHTCGRCRIPASRRAYWVGKLSRNAARDRQNRRLLTKAGWGVLTI